MGIEEPTNSLTNVEAIELLGVLLVMAYIWSRYYFFADWFERRKFARETRGKSFKLDVCEP